MKVEGHKHIMPVAEMLLFNASTHFQPIASK